VRTWWRDGVIAMTLQVVRDARKRGLPSLLILEDDVVFDPSITWIQTTSGSRAS
jgi:hypothetical protein